MDPSPGKVTRLLRDAGGGSERAVDELLPLVYDELRALAARLLRDERRDHTLQPTAVVHEAYLRLVGVEEVDWTDRAHFFRAAARSMRRILVDHARKRCSAKRGGAPRRISIQIDDIADRRAQQINVLDLDEALCTLAKEYPPKAQVVELRSFGGLTTEETARAMDVTTRTVERHWRFARAWLYRALRPDGEAPA